MNQFSILLPIYLGSVLSMYLLLRFYYIDFNDRDATFTDMFFTIIPVVNTLFTVILGIAWLIIAIAGLFNKNNIPNKFFGRK